MYYGYLSEIEGEFFSFKNVTVSTSRLSRTGGNTSENTTSVELILEGLFKNSKLVSGIDFSS